MNCKISEDEINILSKVSKLSLQNVFSSIEIFKKKIIVCHSKLVVVDIKC